MQYCSGKSRISKNIANEICKREITNIFSNIKCDNGERERVKQSLAYFVELVP